MYELVDQKNDLTYLDQKNEKTEKQWSQCCHEKLRKKLFEKYYVVSFHFNTKSWIKKPTKTQINVLKNFYGIF